MEAHQREVEAHQREVEAIKVRLREKDDAHQREVEAIKGQLEGKDDAHRREVEAIKGQLEEKDERIREKDRRLQHLENESSDVLTHLRDEVKRNITTHPKRGEYCWPAHQFLSLITSP